MSEPWVISALISGSTLLVTIVAYVFDQGRRQGRIDRLITEHDLTRQDFQTAVAELRKMFFDVNGNPRLMSVSECVRNQGTCVRQFSDIKDIITKSNHELMLRDTELFSRLRALEKSNVEVVTELKIRNEKENGRGAK